MRAAVTDSLPTAKPEMKPWIAAIHAYVPGKSKAADGRPLVKLSANENPLGTSPAALAARTNAGAPALYPDPDSVELREAPIAELYFLAQQDLWPAMSLVVRSNVEPASLSASVRQAVNEVDRSVPVADVKTMDHVVSESITQPRFNLFLLGLFSAVAMLLSAAGIYGVTAYTVTQRTRELGIRIALGAQVGDVLKMILGQGMAVIGIGLIAGLAAAFELMRLLRSLLFGVGENDPLTFAAITGVLVLVALIACYLPARRATKVDPLVALRAE